VPREPIETARVLPGCDERRLSSLYGGFERPRRGAICRRIFRILWSGHQVISRADCRERLILSPSGISYVDVTWCRDDLGDTLQVDDSILREKAREAIENGKLPTQYPERIMGGPGCGDMCAICGETLPRNQMELEPEFRLDGAIAESHKYHLHPRCFMAWELERTKDGASTQGPPSI